MQSQLFSSLSHVLWPGDKKGVMIGPPPRGVYSPGAWRSRPCDLELSIRRSKLYGAPSSWPTNQRCPHQLKLSKFFRGQVIRSSSPPSGLQHPELTFFLKLDGAPPLHSELTSQVGRSSPHSLGTAYNHPEMINLQMQSDSVSDSNMGSKLDASNNL